jgi:membrane protein
MMLAAGALLLVTLLLMSADQVVGAAWFYQILERFPTLYALQGFGVRYGTIAILIIAVGLVFYFIPNAKVRFRDVWVGAVLTGLLWRGAFLGFSWYVRDMSRFSVHGSIAAVVVFLLWIYISAVILLYGVEFTAAYGRLRRRRPEQIPAAPAPRI